MNKVRLFTQKKQFRPKPLKLNSTKIIKPIIKGALLGIGLGIGYSAYKQVTQ